MEEGKCHIPPGMSLVGNLLSPVWDCTYNTTIICLLLLNAGNFAPPNVPEAPAMPEVPVAIEHKTGVGSRS